MRRTNPLILILITLAAFLLAGCGGGTGVNTLPSRFAANWAGTWTLASAGQTGTMSGTIDSAGNFSGTIHNNTTGADGTFTGTVGDNGVTYIAIKYASTSYTGAGTASINPNGHLVATLVVSSGQGVYSFDLTQQ